VEILLVGYKSRFSVKQVRDRKFNLSINTTGFPSGSYSMTAKALNGTFEFDELNISSLLWPAFV
jgi:hypothetical protein